MDLNNCKNRLQQIQQGESEAEAQSDSEIQNQLLFRMVQISIQEENTQEAIKLLEKIIENSSKSQQLDVFNSKIVFHVLGQLLYQEDDYERSIEYFKLYYNYTDLEERELCLFKIAKAHTKLGNFFSAQQNYDLALQLNPKNYKTHMKLGWMQAFYGVYDDIVIQGIDNLKKALTLDLDNPKIIIKLADANLLVQEGEAYYKEALELYKYLLEQNFEEYKWSCLLGMAKSCQQMNKKDEAIVYAKQAVENSEGAVKEKILFYLGLLYKSNSDDSNGLQCFQQILQQNANHVDALIEYSSFTAKQQKFDKTRDILKYAIRNDPKNLIANFRLGQLYQLVFHDLIQAKLCYQNIIDTNPNYYIGYYQLGQVYYELEDIDQAIKYLFKSLELQPKFQEAWKYLGRIFLERQKYQKAIKFYNKAAQLDPSDRFLKRTIGDIYYFNENYEQAIFMYEQLILMNEQNKQRNFNDELEYCIGNCYFKLDDLQLALEHYSNAILINPQYEECLYNIGNIYAMRFKFEEAIEYYHNCYQVSLNTASLFNQGNCYYALLNHEKAFEVYEKFVEEDKYQHMEWINQVAELMIQHHREQKAEEILQKAFDMGTYTIDSLIILAQYYMEMKNKEKAIPILKKAWELNLKRDELETLVSQLNVLEQFHFKSSKPLGQGAGGNRRFIKKMERKNTIDVQ